MLTEDTPDGASASAATKQHFKNVRNAIPHDHFRNNGATFAKISLLDQRQTMQINLVTTTEFMKAQPNDYVNITNERLGFTNKLFKIEDMSLTFWKMKALFSLLSNYH